MSRRDHGQSDWLLLFGAGRRRRRRYVAHRFTGTRPQGRQDSKCRIQCVGDGLHIGVRRVGSGRSSCPGRAGGRGISWSWSPLSYTEWDEPMTHRCEITSKCEERVKWRHCVYCVYVCSVCVWHASRPSAGGSSWDALVACACASWRRVSDLRFIQLQRCAHGITRTGGGGLEEGWMAGWPARAAHNGDPTRDFKGRIDKTCTGSSHPRD